MFMNTYAAIGIVAVIAIGGLVFLSGQQQSAPQNSTNSQAQSMNKETTMEQNTTNTIVDVAVAAGNFTTLVQAVQAAGLVETLQGPGPFTVFAPSDEAFAKINKATLESILADKEQLTAILTYHVVPGKVMAKDVASLTRATTVQGGDLTIRTANGVQVNNARVVTTDIEASNGVIHVIDTVLLPQ